MNKMEMLQEMTRRVKEDDSLAISNWQGSYLFENGMPKSSSLVDTNEIDIPGSPEMPEGEMTAVEMLVTSMANCYSTTLHKNAFERGVSLERVEINLNSKFDIRPFLGLNEDHPGLLEAAFLLNISSDADHEEINNLAMQSLKQSPVLRSLSAEVDLKVKSL